MVADIGLCCDHDYYLIVILLDLEFRDPTSRDIVGCLPLIGLLVSKTILRSIGGPCGDLANIGSEAETVEVRTPLFRNRKNHEHRGGGVNNAGSVHDRSPRSRDFSDRGIAHYPPLYKARRPGPMNWKELTSDNIIKGIGLCLPAKAALEGGSRKNCLVFQQVGHYWTLPIKKIGA